MESTVKLYSLNFSNLKTYLLIGLFVIGNILLPQLCHLIPNGGHILLPIYFFTLIAAYKFGWKVGLLTAVLSPLVNAVLFGMPLMVSLPAIISKSVLLAVAASWAAHRFHRISLLILLGVVLFYQVVGTAFEWLYVGDFYAAAQDFRLGIIGMFLQIVGGYAFIKYLLGK